MRRFMLTAGLGVAAALRLVACKARAPEQSSAAVQTSAAIDTTTVNTGTVEQTIVTYGTVEFAADRQRTLSFVKAGQVTRVPIVAGQTVAKGTPLLSVGGVPEGALEVQQGNIDLEYAERELARVQRLVDEKLATSQDLQAAEKQVAASKAALRGLGAGTGGSTLVAPSDGVVAEVLVERGERVQAGQAAVVIAARDSMAVRAGFEVEDLPRLKEGLRVRVRPVYGAASETTDAALSRLHRVVDPKTQLVQGLIHVDEPPPWMAGGLAVEVTVVIESHDSVVRVPKDALVERSGKRGVFVVSDGHAHFRLLKFGIDGGNVIEVKEGLKPGARIATIGRTSLSDGMAVRLAGADKP